MRTASPIHRLTVAAALLIAAMVACGREVTGPVSSPSNLFRRFAAFAFSTQVESAMPASALPAALQQVEFERVRVTLRREDGTIALDTVVLFPVGATQVTLTLNVPLPANAPASGVPLNLSLGYVNAAGDTVFKGGPLPVTVLPGTGGTPPAPVQVPIRYSGPGASASAVVITPKLLSGFAGQTTNFSAQAVGPTGQPLPGTPIAFTSSNDAVVSINETSGAATLRGRGTAKVYALLLTGQADSALVTVSLPASQLQLASGGGQTGPAGSTLAAPVVARVLADDGIGVSGVTVNFSVSGGGTVTPASAVSTADGTVSAQWKLGATAGTQTLTATSAGLTGSPLTVEATARAVTPTRLVILTGPASGKAAVALPAMTVAAQDVGGNTVSSFTGDVTVAIGTNPGNATLSGATTIKAEAGVATFSDLKLDKPGTGYTLVFSSASLSSATSAGFNITAGDVSKLAFGPMPAGVDAGIAIAPPITVTAQDVAGNPVTTFTGDVTLVLGANPGGATLGGTLTRASVAGVATFGDLTVNKSGVGYTLSAASTGLVGATSSAFSVTPGAPSRLSIVRGNGQSAPAGSQLSEIVVRLGDALGNGIPGATIAFAVTGGGGSLSSATGITDADGNASVLWTIGAGPQTMSAAFTGLPPVVVTATSTSVSLVWTGAVSADWNTAGNWSPAFVPSASDVVTIPVTSTSPIISAPASVVGVSVAAGATLTNNATLTVNGSVDAGTTIVGSGSLVLAGASGTLKGVINQSVTITGAAYTLAGATQIAGNLTIGGTGKLTIGGQTLAITGSLATASSGRLAMMNTADVVTVATDASFAGGSEAGYLTAGMLSVSGNFTASGATFSASGSHTLKLSGASTAQLLTFASPITGQGINHLTFANGAAKSLSGALQVMGDVLIAGTSSPVDGSATVKIAGNFTDETILPDSGGSPNPLGGWRVAATYFHGANKTINSTFITSNVTVSGTVRFAPCTTCLTGAMASLVATNGYVQINGDLTVSGSGAVLALNGNEVDVTGNFATASGGVVDMTDGMDYLYVYGSATFAGGSTAGRLTNGTLEVLQNFTQSGAADAFAPAAGFYTYIGYPYATTTLRASRAMRSRAIIGEAPPRSETAESWRASRSRQALVARTARFARMATLDRRAAAYASRGMAAPPPRWVSSGPNAAAEGSEVRLLRSRSQVIASSTISFANPTTSFFGTLYLSGSETSLASDVLVLGELETGYSAWHQVNSSSATSRKVTSHGADVRDLGFNNVSWVLLDGYNVWSMDYVEFNNMDPTADQFTVARAFDERGMCDCSPFYELYYWAFYTTPTSGHYIKATDTNGGTNLLELYMYNPDPSAHGGHIATAGGALITNWPETAVVTWLGTTSSNWNVASNWTGGMVPTSSDDVLIPYGTPYVPTTNTAAGYTHHLTIESGAHIQTSCSYELYVYGNVVAPLDAPAVQTCEGDAIHLMGDGTPGGNTVVGNFEMLTVEGLYKVAGPGNQVIVGLSWGSLKIAGVSANLVLNGNRVDANQLMISNGGILTMTNPADVVYVAGDNAYFDGGSTSGTLTAGTMYVKNGGCLYAGSSASAFAPSGTHQVIFEDGACVSFNDPISSFFQDVTIASGSTLTVDTDNPSYPGLGFNVNGTLTRSSGSSAISILAGYSVTNPIRYINVSGLNITGGPTYINSVGIRFVAGTNNATFNEVTFYGYAGYTLPILTITRPSGNTYTFNSLDFSAVTGMTTGGVYVSNTNSGVTVNILSSLPAGSTLWSGFNVNWP